MPRPAAPFRIPNIQGMVYAPGPQPNAPGESHLPYAGHMGNRFTLSPWPSAVPVLSVLSSNSGTPRMRAPLPVVNREALLPSDYLWINGFVGKSQG